ncbi:hypothetical protein [Oceanisphaera sp. KMM 10153]|uniref:hypothetical protein n=1 Tax=Oceanisphaera submarina TaxID=3390193 RepID=UPI003975E1ED
MKIFEIEIDNVLGGVVAFGSTSYDYAFETLIPLINKTEFQRKLQDKKFYMKLERDIENGCVMPPITVAFITDEIEKQSTIQETNDFISQNIRSSFILDGIQRLNTLFRLEKSEKLNKKKKLYINFIFCDSTEKLLYRMITLNNGQRPMTPRHQVEAMMNNAFDFEKIGVNVQTEKDSKKLGKEYFRKSDIIQAYLAFMAESPIVDNKKIIEEKMDELLVNKIMSVEPINYKSKFDNVLKAIAKFQVDDDCLKWLRVTNNLVGFAVGLKSNTDDILSLSIEEFKTSLNVFDSAFSEFNPSKIKVGKYRRELSCEYFRNFKEYKGMDENELLDCFSELTSHD